MIRKEDTKSFFDLIEQEDSSLPRNESARLAVLKARDIVRRNNEFIHKIKLESNIYRENDQKELNVDLFFNEGTYAFDQSKIKSKNNISELVKDVLGI
jgi:hypothetical protein